MTARDISIRLRTLIRTTVRSPSLPIRVAADSASPPAIAVGRYGPYIGVGELWVLSQMRDEEVKG